MNARCINDATYMTLETHKRVLILICIMKGITDDYMCIIIYIIYIIIYIILAKKLISIL